MVAVRRATRGGADVRIPRNPRIGGPTEQAIAPGTSSTGVTIDGARITLWAGSGVATSTAGGVTDSPRWESSTAEAICIGQRTPGGGQGAHGPTACAVCGDQTHRDKAIST